MVNGKVSEIEVMAIPKTYQLELMQIQDQQEALLPFFALLRCYKTHDDFSTCKLSSLCKCLLLTSYHKQGLESAAATLTSDDSSVI